MKIRQAIPACIVAVVLTALAGCESKELKSENATLRTEVEGLKASINEAKHLKLANAALEAVVRIQSAMIDERPESKSSPRLIRVASSDKDKTKSDKAQEKIKEEHDKVKDDKDAHRAFHDQMNNAGEGVKEEMNKFCANRKELNCN